MPVSNRTQELLRHVADTSNMQVLESTYTCDCGMSEYNDVQTVIWVGGKPYPFTLPRVSECPTCRDGNTYKPMDEWAYGKICKMLESGIGLYIWGGFGTGKTTAAERLRDEAAREGRRVTMVTSSRFITKLMDTIGTYEREADVIDSYAAMELLIVDDIGNEKLSESALSKIWALANARYEAGRPTIWTSNYPLDELVGRYAEVNPKMAQSLGSRIYGLSERIELGGEDRRMS